jgi:hypothetical protein
VALELNERERGPAGRRQTVAGDRDMREQKPFRLGPQQGSPGSGPADDKNGLEKVVDDKPMRVNKASRLGWTMHSDVQMRKPRGRLNRETMNKLGKVLEAYYDDVRNQGVPDRFKDLLQQIDDRKDTDKGSS